MKPVRLSRKPVRLVGNQVRFSRRPVRLVCKLVRLVRNSVLFPGTKEWISFLPVGENHTLSVALG